LRYFIQFSYFGKAYHGWQAQPNAVTVQEVLQQTMSTLLRTNINLVGAGRTDAGVHAKQLFAHFDVQRALEIRETVQKLNSFLPSDIAVQRVFQVMPEAHARFDAIARTYEYHVVQEKNPFLTDYEKTRNGPAGIQRRYPHSIHDRVHWDRGSESSRPFR